MTDRWGAVICAETAHINVDECGAPEKVGGLKLLTVPTPDGKLTPELIDRQAWGWGDEHRAQPQVVSITQTTELGTCYTVRGDRGDRDHAHELGMVVHLDGARIANAAATLGVPLRAFTDRRPASTCCPSAAPRTACCSGSASWCSTESAVRGLDFLRKTAMQLASKMRFVSAQFDALLAGDLWLRNASHANAMARRLEAAVRDIARRRDPAAGAGQRGLRRHPAGGHRAAAEAFRFYVWDEPTGEVRWMCAFDTTEEDVDGFAAAVAAEMGAA